MLFSLSGSCASSIIDGVDRGVIDNLHRLPQKQRQLVLTSALADGSVNQKRWVRALSSPEFLDGCGSICTLAGAVDDTEYLFGVAESLRKHRRLAEDVENLRLNLFCPSEHGGRSSNLDAMLELVAVCDRLRNLHIQIRAETGGQQRRLRRVRPAIDQEEDTNTSEAPMSSCSSSLSSTTSQTGVASSLVAGVRDAAAGLLRTMADVMAGGWWRRRADDRRHPSDCLQLLSARCQQHRFATLESLRVDGTRMLVQPLRLPPTLSRLRSLHLRAVTIADPEWRQFLQLARPHLRELSLELPWWQPDTLALLPFPLHRLTRFQCLRGGVCDAVLLDNLRRCEELRDVALCLRGDEESQLLLDVARMDVVRRVYVNVQNATPDPERLGATLRILGGKMAGFKADVRLPPDVFQPLAAECPTLEQLTLASLPDEAESAFRTQMRLHGPMQRLAEVELLGRCPSELLSLLLGGQCPSLSRFIVRDCLQLTDDHLRLWAAGPTTVPAEFAIKNCPAVTDDGLCSLLPAFLEKLLQLVVEHEHYFDVSFRTVAFDDFGVVRVAASSERQRFLRRVASRSIRSKV